LLGLLNQSADANQLLTELRFLVCFALDRFACRGQSPGRLGGRRAQRVDPGEDGLPLIACSVGNAVAALTGVRLRELPFAPDRVRGALGA